MSTALLEIPEFRRRVSAVTVEQYHQFPEFNENGRRTELIRGIVIEKMSKSPLHCTILRQLSELLQAALPANFVLFQQDPPTLADSEPEPDIAIVRGTVRDFFSHHPTTAALVIEIAVTSATEDRALAALYAEAGVEEYWIVLPRERQIEVYRRPGGGTYAERTFIEGDVVVACGSVPGVQVALGKLFGGLDEPA